MIKLYVCDFDKYDNAQWIAITKYKGKIKKLCLGFYNFTFGYCVIYNTAPIFIKYSEEIFEELRYRDWNTFKLNRCKKSIRHLIKRFVKKYDDYSKTIEDNDSK